MIHITIVGLKSNQAHLVERQFAGTIRFSFLPADRSSTRMPTGADWVIMSRFIPHRWSRAAFGQFPRGRVVFCGGGMVSIRRHVEQALEALEPSRWVA